MTEVSSVVDEIISRNRDFAARTDVVDLTMLPAGRRIVVSCVDPRVDPAVVLGVELGEAAVIRNLGGRITPATFRTLALLAMIAQNDGVRPGPGWNLVVLHHTDCGISRLADHPDALAAELGTSPDQLEPAVLADPRASLEADLHLLHANPMLPRGLIVSGLLYDTKTGGVETVVAPAAL